MITLFYSMEILFNEVNIGLWFQFLSVLTLLYLVTGGDVPDFIYYKSGLNLIFCRQAEE